MPQHAWNKVTLVSTLHFFMVGAVNLYVAYNYSMATWVSFKLWSAFLFTILWAVIIGVIMGPNLKEADVSEPEDSRASQAKSAATDANDETTRTF